MKIIAISGGHIGETIGGKTYPPDSARIYKEIVTLSKKKNPRVLFIPAASNDSEYYCTVVKKYFKKFGCRVSNLLLIKEGYSRKELINKILNTDIIYVGGGNTLKMMNIWRRMGVDKLLLQAYHKDVVLSGVSAGAICWFRQGNSDSRKFKNPNAGLIKVSGLNQIDALYCPHYDEEKDRKTELKEMMKKTKGVAIACDNCIAVEIIDKKYRIIASKNSANAYKCYWKKNKYNEEKILKSTLFRPINELIKK